MNRSKDDHRLVPVEKRDVRRGPAHEEDIDGRENERVDSVPEQRITPRFSDDESRICAAIARNRFGFLHSRKKVRVSHEVI